MAESQQPGNGRLESWKEIAAYLARDVRTVQRWEKNEGLPVYRHVHGERGSVYAVTGEIDTWLRSRDGANHDTAQDAAPGIPRLRRVRIAVWVCGFAAIAVACLAIWLVAVHFSKEQPSTVAGYESPGALRFLATSTSQGQELDLLNVGAPADAVAVSPNGRELYVLSTATNTVRVVNLASRALTHSIPAGDRPSTIVIDRRGALCYVGNRGGNVNIVDTATKQVQTVVTGGPVLDTALTPDGRTLYLAMEFSGVKKMSTATKTVTTVSPAVCPRHLALSPDGQRLYVNYQCGGPGGRTAHDAIDVFSTRDDSPIATMVGPPSIGGPLAVSPDEQFLWADGRDACSSPEYDHTGCPQVPAGIINVWRLPDHSLLRTVGLPLPELSGFTFGFSPNGLRLALAGDVLQVFDPHRFVATETLPLAVPGRPAFSSDGKRLYVPLGQRNQVAVFEVRNEPQPKPDGFRALWPGDGNANEVASLNNGAVEGHVGYAPGKIGQAFQFDGKSGFLRAGLGNLEMGHEFTLLAWVLFEGQDRADLRGEMSIIDKMVDGATNRVGWRLLKRADNRVVFCLGGGKADGCATGSPTAVISRNPVTSGAWLHLAAVRQRGSLSLFLDGAHDSTAAVTAGQDAAAEIRFGARNPAGAMFRGLIDEIEFYERALSPAEIQSRFRAAAPRQ